MTCTFEYAATRGQYGKVLASDTMVDLNGKANTTCLFGWWSLGYLHKASFILLLRNHFKFIVEIIMGRHTMKFEKGHHG